MPGKNLIEFRATARIMKKNNLKNEPWRGLGTLALESACKDFYRNNFRIFGVVYTKCTPEFKEAYKQARIWEKLGD